MGDGEELNFSDRKNDEEFYSRKKFEESLKEDLKLRILLNKNGRKY